MKYEFYSTEEMEELIHNNLVSFPAVEMGSQSVESRADGLLGLYELPTDTVIVHITQDRTFFGIMQTLTHESIHGAVRSVAGDEIGFAVDMISKIDVPLYVGAMGAGIE